MSGSGHFDFASYLNKIDPGLSYDIQRLVGGCVNFTVRATKSSHIVEGLFTNHKSLVLKYAPPFVAYLGEDAPFSQHRQTIEARALELFSPNGVLDGLSHKPPVLVPSLLYHDVEAHVLIISDLGTSSNLSDILRSLPDNLENGSRDTIIAEYTQMGSQLGLFFADLHSRSSRDLIGAENMGDFDSPDNKALVFATLIETLKGYLDKVGLSDSAELYERARDDFLETVGPDQEYFCFGDAWTGAILKLEGASKDNRTRLGIVDWEFAGRGRALSDMAQLLADLHAYLIMAPSPSTLRLAIATLIKSICSSYRHRSRENMAPWALSRDVRSDSLPSRSLDVLGVTLHTFRSAYILHGREMVAYAFRRVWKCSCCDGPQKDGCLLRQKMILEGAWYLRKAGRNIAEFLEPDNWIEVGSERDWVLGGLIFGS